MVTVKPGFYGVHLSNSNPFVALPQIYTKVWYIFPRNRICLLLKCNISPWPFVLVSVFPPFLFTTPLHRLDCQLHLPTWLVKAEHPFQCLPTRHPE